MGAGVGLGVRGRVRVRVRGRGRGRGRGRVLRVGRAGLPRGPVALVDVVGAPGRELDRGASRVLVAHVRREDPQVGVAVRVRVTVTVTVTVTIRVRARVRDGDPQVGVAARSTKVGLRLG